MCLMQGYLCGPSCCFPGATIELYLMDGASERASGRQAGNPQDAVRLGQEGLK